jgi:hypothetical protein
LTLIPNLTRLLPCQAAAIGLIFAVTSNFALAQSAYPFNSAIYKSSHNSYARDESLAQQIDDYNVWQIELDLCSTNDGLKVSHTCDAGTLASASTLQNLLQKLLTESKTYTQKFTVVYFDLKQNWDTDSNSAASVKVHNEIASTIQALFGSHLFTPDQLTADGTWPSVMQLNESGFYWAVVVDWHGAKSTPAAARVSAELFTVAISDPPTSAQEFASAVLVNVDGGCDASPTSETPTNPRGRWLYRYWPSCGQDCQQLNGNYWSNGVAKAYNFVATNCINWDHTFQPPTQSPQPLFVDSNLQVHCPNGYSSCEWGTLGFPFHDLAEALQRASPMTTVSIQAAVYTLASGSTILSKPLTLRASGGPATIR